MLKVVSYKLSLELQLLEQVCDLFHVPTHMQQSIVNCYSHIQ